jgi:tetratricopeptide (TPR) repeat protein
VRKCVAGWLLAGACGLAFGPARAHGQDAALWQRAIEDAKAAYRQKDYDRSGQLLQTALHEAEKFGADDPRLAVTLHNLANLAAVQGKSAEAEPLARRALAILEKVRGPDHSQTAVVRLGLADLLAAQGKDVEAEADYRGALRAFEKVLGPDHPIVATTLERYAALLRRVGRTAEADQLEARAREARAKQAGKKG